VRTALAVLTGRAIRVLARLRGGGSAFPGRVALLIAPRFLQRAVEKLPLGVVFVSGSNGKSTTTQMLVSILRAHDVDVFTNPSGANLPQGIASAILADAPLDGRLHHDIAVLEVDEAFGPGLAQRLVPHSVLLINVQVDQLNRFYEPDRVVGMLESFAGVATRHLVVNADDHNLVDLAHRLSGRGAELSAFAMAPELLAESAWLARGDNPALATSEAATLTASTRLASAHDELAVIEVDGIGVDVTLPARGLHNAVDATAAFAMARALLDDRFDPAAASRGVSGMLAVFGRGEIIDTPGGDEFELLMMKNPPSMQVNLDALAGTPERVLIAVDEGTPDPSWIYGTDFSKLTRVDVITGTKCWQFATRLAYEGIEIDAVIPDLKPALERFIELPAPSGRKTLIVNYEQMMLIRKQLGHREMEGAP
jgi:UDP-N-acetylmuramyl tripeptide synthase